MNACYLDIAGVLLTINQDNPEFWDKKFKVLKEMYDRFDLKIFIESSCKGALDDETFEVLPDASDETRLFFGYFKKYDIKISGKTPEVYKYLDSKRHSYVSMWKEDEIRLHLMRHPEIEHYVIIDDDDNKDKIFNDLGSDLNKVRDHLVETIGYDRKHLDEEGLLPRHIEEVGKILQKENHIRTLLLKKDAKRANH